jgi:hypothetical protein
MNVYSHSTSNDYALNSIEYLVKKKTDSATRLKRFLIVFVALVIALASCLLISKIPAAGAIIIILIAYIVKVLWSKTSIEYEYVIIQGEFTMDAIIGAKKRKNLTSFLIREAEKIAPYNGTAPDGAVLINACISPDDPSTWCAVYKDKDGKKTALLFSAYNKSIEIMSYYNKQAVSNESIKDGAAE